MKMLTAEDIAGYLESDVSPHTQARNDLVLEIRNAVDEAIASGDVPEGTPYAATFTLDELAERGLKNDKGTGPGLKKSRGDNGPILKVARIAEGSYLVVLNSDWLAEHPDFPETGGTAE
ncbi:MAG: hypothetical protein EHM35_11870 [Planctomycetaceae bacterium]|nr:MAG: hypothetical protein EHM35_11870 [Planctomycetaceae bacterium]